MANPDALADGSTAEGKPSYESNTSVEETKEYTIVSRKD